jgi:hypothetical protein
MLIASKGIRTDKFYIQPFELNPGEIIVLYLFNGVHFYETEMYLKDIFTGKTVNESVTVNKPLTFVEHFIEPGLRRMFYPVSVGEYLKKHANPESHFATKIYEWDWITPKTKVNNLAGSPRGRLRLFATLSRTNNIVFDFVGQDPKGCEESYGIIKECVKNGGAAILLDCCKDMKDDCTKYIELEWVS